MSTKIRTLGVTLVIAAILLVSLGLYLRNSDRRIRLVLDLQQQLIENGDLGRRESNVLKTRLKETVDAMDRDTVRLLQKRMHESKMKRLRESAGEYALQSGDGRDSIIQRDSAILGRSREIEATVWAQRRKEDRRWWMEQKEKEERRLEAGDDKSDEKASREERKSAKNRRENANEDEEMSPEEKKVFDDYIQALKNRSGDERRRKK